MYFLTMLRNALTFKDHPEDSASWRWVVYLVLFWLSIFAAVLWIKNTWPQGFRGPLQPLEFVLYLVIFLTVLYPVRLREVFMGIGPVRRIAFLLIVGGMTIGQMVNNSGLTYPFQPWTMFTAQRASAEFYDYPTRFASGEERSFPFRRVFPAASRAMLSQIEGRPVAFGRDFPDIPPLADGLRHLVDVHNRRWPDDPIVSVEVYRNLLDMRDFTNRESIRRELVLHLEFDP